MAQEQQAIVWDVATVFILSGSVWCGFSSVEPFLAHFHPRVARPLHGMGSARQLGPMMI